MKLVLAATLVCSFATAALAEDASCKAQATDKKLAGAALTSFMTKCQKDAQSACEMGATDKKLAGAAKSSFVKKCVSDRTGGA
jgi:hypothetical protein